MATEAFQNGRAKAERELIQNYGENMPRGSEPRNEWGVPLPLGKMSDGEQYERGKADAKAGKAKDLRFPHTSLYHFGYDDFKKGKAQNGTFQNGPFEEKVRKIVQKTGKKVHEDWVKKFAQNLKEGSLSEAMVEDFIKSNNYSGPNW